MASADKSKRRDQKNGGEEAPIAAGEVAFDFIKAHAFRVIHVDGAFGGLSPSARTMNIAVYSERRPLPRKTVHPISETGVVGDELADKRDSRLAFVREIEANLVMDLDTARALRAWLDRHIAEMTKIQKIEPKGEPNG